jgi:tetrahydromethanopterin S-methyltransferase subunit G
MSVKLNSTIESLQELISSDEFIEEDPSEISPKDVNDNFLERYYSSLAQVEKRNQELLNTREELGWYENQLKEAKKLTVQNAIGNASNTPCVSLSSKDVLSKERTKLALANVYSEVEKYQNIQKYLDDTTSRLQNKLESTKSQSQNNLKSTKLRLQNELNSTISDLNKKLQSVKENVDKYTCELEQLKTKKMIEALIIISSGIITVLVFQNLVSVIFIMLVTWWIRSTFWL